MAVDTVLVVWDMGRVFCSYHETSIDDTNVVAPAPIVSDPQDLKVTFSRTFRMNTGDSWACSTRSHIFGVLGWDGNFPRFCGMSTGDTRVYGTDIHRFQIVEHKRDLS